ncbi:MAG: hypothetical protein EOO24_57730, partial [Comamonadaceae bacterium]
RMLSQYIRPEVNRPSSRTVATASTSAALMIPLFGVSWGALFMGEPVTSGMLPGALLVLAATALITGFNPLRRRAGRTPPGA